MIILTCAVKKIFQCYHLDIAYCFLLTCQLVSGFLNIRFHPPSFNEVKCSFSHLTTNYLAYLANSIISAGSFSIDHALCWFS